MADRRNSGTEPDDDKSGQNLKYKGVRKRKWGKWVSEIRLPNSRARIWLGSYEKPEQAARAFDAAQFCLRGPHARFNFPDTPPAIEGGDRLTAQEIQAAAAKFAAGHGGGEERRADNEEYDVPRGENSNSAVVDGRVWPDWDMFDGGSEFGFGNIIMGGNEMIYDGDIIFPVQEDHMEEVEFVDGGEYFCHEPNFLWNFDNY